MTKRNKQTSGSRGATPRHGFDGSGHLAAANARYLLDLARATHSADGDEAFLSATFTDDALAEELAEAAVANMTSGEDQLTETFEAEVDEEQGGPFVETSGGTEFAGGTDESNIAEATREPFPRANGFDRTRRR